MRILVLLELARNLFMRIRRSGPVHGLSSHLAIKGSRKWKGVAAMGRKIFTNAVVRGNHKWNGFAALGINRGRRKRSGIAALGSNLSQG